MTNAYLAGVQRRVKQLDDRLSLVVGVFYFISTRAACSNTGWMGKVRPR